MPYINIKENDIVSMAGFDTVENAVLIFGFDFHRKDDASKTLKDIGTYGNKAYKLYTSIKEFNKDIPITAVTKVGGGTNNLLAKAYRPYITAYDCLTRGLPVIYVPLDDYIDGDVVMHLPEKTDPEGTVIRPEKFLINYNWLSEPQMVTKVPDEEDYDTIETYWKVNEFSRDEALEAYAIQTDESIMEYAAENALDNILEYDYTIPGTTVKITFSDLVPLSDKVNLPITFITTCGFENYHRGAKGKFYGRIRNFLCMHNTTEPRLDVLYLYDLPSEDTPEYISQVVTEGEDEAQLPQSFTNGEIVDIVYPWGHYDTYFSVGTPLHMPGSYARLMAYAASIKNNMPWLAVAGITRGVIPNIVSLDYDIKESYVHQWQGELNYEWNNRSIRINPIINLGNNYGKVIFGNRTCYGDVSNAVTTFKKFLNIRMLLIFIHKQAFKVSMTHMFEPNDDIVWLSFKQGVNTLLDRMVSGRGLKWYKWFKIRPEDPRGNLILGQLKAKLTIRPIEAIESFDITINMTDSDIEVDENPEVR